MAGKGALQGKPRILVIGVGNAYRGDDAAGLVVAQRLQQEIHNLATIREESGDGAALIESWKDADAVILIDAVQSGAKPGTLYCFDAHAQPIPAKFFRYSTHTFSVAEAIELARALDQLPPCLVVYGIEGQTFTAGVGLSPAVKRSIGDVAERVRQEVAAWRSVRDK